MPNFTFSRGTVTKLDFLLEAPGQIPYYEQQLVYNITTPFKLSRENILLVVWGQVSEYIECDLYLIPAWSDIEHPINMRMITTIPTRGCVPGAWHIRFSTHDNKPQQILVKPTIPGMLISIQHIDLYI